ncbi:hypothetical protein BHE74_00003979 [Ensete ventricosum]|nr:hypothetical protein BHE74_00003979 [Ensete ventricosum]
MAVEGAEGFNITSREVTIVLQALWFNHSSYSYVKEMAAIRVYGCRAFTSPRISGFKPLMKRKGDRKGGLIDLRLRDDGGGDILKQLRELLGWVEVTKMVAGAAGT